MSNTIKTQRLEIRPFSQEDTACLAALLLHEDIKKTYMIPDFADQAALDRMLQTFFKLSLSDDHFTRGIYESGTLIGFVNDVEISDACIELGYVIHPDRWNRGYATEMLCAVIDELLEKRFSVIKTGAFSENPASMRVMEKCGMQKCPQTESVEYRGIKHSCVYYQIKKKWL